MPGFSGAGARRRQRSWDESEKRWNQACRYPRVAREAGITASQLFQWRKANIKGLLVAIGANELVVPASELQDVIKPIKQLAAALGRKMLENDIGNVAVNVNKAKKWLARSPLLPGDDQ